MVEFNNQKDIKEKDIFDILGISSREDSFTDLLAETFNDGRNQEFRDRFCKSISNDTFKLLHTEDCKILTRKVLYVDKNKSTGERSKISPDMLLISPSQRAVAIIENKIFSGEGYQQTIAYSSLSFEGIFNLEFYYMTLLGEMPSSTNFKPLKWTDLIIETCKDVKFALPFDILIEALLSRANELKEFIEMPLDSSKSFTDYCYYLNKWIDPKIVFEKYFNPLFEFLMDKYGRTIECSVSKGEGRSPQLYVLLSMKDWNSNNLDEYHKGEEIGRFEHTRNIHVEFDWHIGSKDKDASIMIHYETNPYYPYEKFKKEYPKIEPYYAKSRNEFKSVIAMAIDQSVYWTKSNTKLALARTRCENFSDIPFSDFRNWFESVFTEAYVIINDGLFSSGF